MGWDTRKDQILRDHYGKGQKTASEIASLIGDGITRNSVIGRASRLGLSGNIKIKKKLMIKQIIIIISTLKREAKEVNLF